VEIEQQFWRKQMNTNSYKTPVIVALVVSSLILCGCNEELRLHPIYHQAITGAIVGGIIGYQSHEEGEGAALGAAILGIGELLEQIDKNKRPEKEYEEEDIDGFKEVFVIQVHNSNGSITPVEIEKKDDMYFGQKGEMYEQLPTEEQLKPIYGF
jgi:hypothetical protein